MAVFGVGAALAYLKFHEDDLVFGTLRSRSEPDGPLPPDALLIDVGADPPLKGVILRPDGSRDSGYWILHMHGNAVSAFSARQLGHCDGLRALGFAVLCFDYRGFGRSAGEASESHMLEDAEAAYRQLLGMGAAPERIIVWGHSLGSGPAVWLASRRQVAALVVFGAFTSIPDAARDAFPLLPVRWLVGIQFDSLRLIDKVRAPVLVAHSVGDALIPFSQGQALFAAANAPKRFLALDDGANADGFGGHVDAIYRRGDLLLAALSALVGPSLVPE